MSAFTVVALDRPRLNKTDLIGTGYTLVELPSSTPLRLCTT